MKSSPLSCVWQHRLRIVVILATIASLFLGGMAQASAQESSRLNRSVQADFVPLSLTAPNCDYGGLFQSIEATDQYTVTFNLCRPDPAFLSKLAFTAFAIYPQEWIAATSGATNRTTEGLENPVGTGPYKVSAWDKGTSITFTRNLDYWGLAPETDTLTFRWAEDPAARLLELQAATIDGYDNVAQGDYGTIAGDPALQLAARSGLNTFYIGMNNTFPRYANANVRRAIAMAIDRQYIVDSYYPPGSEMATHFTPCSIPNGCAGNAWVAYDPVAAKALLATAGFPNGFTTRLYYRNVYRVYLPQPAGIAQEIHDQLLANLNINAEIVVMESGAFIQAVTAGQLNGLYLLGWGADYPHVSNFLDYHFGSWNHQFGNPFPAIYNNLIAAASIADPSLAQPYYAAANNAIRNLVPMVPVAHGGSAVAYLADVTHPQASPFGNDLFAVSDPGGRNEFRWMQSYEPVSLFCADETDGESLRACGQVMQTLYSFVNNSSAVEPALAESCVPNAELTTYTCALRQNVKFHDGTFFDANDVVATFIMGLDESSPTHRGNSNNWEYYRAVWGLMNGCYPLTLTHTGSGGDPVAALANSDGCQAGNYHPGEHVALKAYPAVGWGVKSWTGTNDDSSSSKTNTVTMQAGDRTVTVNYVSVIAAYLKSAALNDGWVLESTETSGIGGTKNTAAATFNVGDDAFDRQYRSILSFNTSGLPDNAVITSATLKIKRQGILGTNPFSTHTGLKADIRKPYFGGSAMLELGDFQAGASLSGAATFNKTPETGAWYSAVLSSSAYPYLNLKGITQFRLRFTRDDNDDLGADYLLFHSGNALVASYKPVLIIEYYLP